LGAYFKLGKPGRTGHKGKRYRFAIFYEQEVPYKNYLYLSGKCRAIVPAEICRLFDRKPVNRSIAPPRRLAQTSYLSVSDKRRKSTQENQ
jgi:hypothetical protein